MALLALLTLTIRGSSSVSINAGVIIVRSTMRCLLLLCLHALLLTFVSAEVVLQLEHRLKSGWQQAGTIVGHFSQVCQLVYQKLRHQQGQALPGR